MGTIPRRDMTVVVHMVCLAIVGFGLLNALLRERSPFAAAYDVATDAAFAAYGATSWVAMQLLPGARTTLLTVMFLGLLVSLIVTASVATPAHDLALTLALTCLTCLHVAVECARRLALWALTRRDGRHAFWWSIAAPRDGGGRYLYRPHACAMRQHFSYAGALDEDGRPHGYGAWSDSAYHGERLTGLWTHGVPTGPYEAVDCTTEYVFRSVRVSFAHDRTEPLDEYWFRGRRREGGLAWGTCSVECSTAGKFYRHLPRVETLSEDVACAACVREWTAHQSHIRRNEPLSISLSDDGLATLRVGGTEVAGDRVVIDVVHEARAPSRLVVRDVAPSQEALVFVHGFNCSVHDAMRRVGQMWTIGDFPSHVHPFVFGWPGMHSVRYFRARERARDAAVADDLSLMLSELRAQGGYETLHLVGHSMGAIVLLEALAREFHGRVRPLVSTEDDARPRVATLTLLNPDADLEPFRAHQARHLAQYCDRVTVYADTSDAVLWLSETFTGRASLGRRPRQLASTEADVVDVTWMDANIPVLRHTFFDLNRLFVDDLREIVTTRHRASQRFRLVHRYDNVWSFMSAPTHVRGT